MKQLKKLLINIQILLNIQFFLIMKKLILLKLFGQRVNQILKNKIINNSMNIFLKEKVNINIKFILLLKFL